MSAPAVVAPSGPQIVELADATALLTRKYGARITFAVDVDAEAEPELIALLKARGVEASIIHPTGHTLEVAKKLGLPSPSAVLVCREA